MIDLNSGSLLSDRFNNRIDKALEIEDSLQPQRKYLGGSRIGLECERALQFEFTLTPKDQGKHFPGRILRIFERGHWVESAMAVWLQKAGFGLIPLDKNGRQFGFSEQGGSYCGHSDGVFVAGPDDLGPWPRLWENKGLGKSGFSKLSKERLLKAYPVYYAQIQVYMKKFNLTLNPAYFSAVCLDDMRLYWEEVVFRPNFESLLDAKSRRIILACENEELLPRVSNDRNYLICKNCAWTELCGKL